ncbi:MAG TPA: DUF4012 domain-containing protein [Actinomycetota bacterium]|nr:DUF4012 domain-containing protein [Actinomycetota bacterium]
MTADVQGPGGIRRAARFIALLALTWLAVGIVSGPVDLALGLARTQAHLNRAEKALQKGSIKTARYETLSAIGASRRARDGLESPGAVDALGVLPKIGPVVDQSDHLVRAAELSAEAARGTLEIAQGALRGPDKIIERDPADPSAGARIRLDRIREIAATVTEIRTAIEGVARELAAVELDGLPRRVREQVRNGIARAASTDEVLADAEIGFELLPDLLGANEPRTYLIGMQNPAEQRGTGGSILQFAPLRIVEGKPSLPKKKASFSVYEVDKNRQTFDIDLPPDAWYVAQIEDAQRFGNANWSPDWPLSAQLLLRYAYAAEPSLPEIHGVFAVDPIMLQNLMRGVGRFKTNYGNVINQRRAVGFLLNKAYAAFPIPSIRRNVLQVVVDRFYEGIVKPKRPTELIQGFGASLTEKHMQIWLRDPAEQAFIERMDWDGGLEPARGADYLNVVEQNVGGNKLDYFQQQTHELDVAFDGDDAHNTVKVSVSNETFLPQPRYVMGDSGGHEHGLTRPMMNVYAPGSARLVAAEARGTLYAMESGAAAWSGSPPMPPEHLELGKKVWPVAFKIPVGDTASVTYDYEVPDVVRTRDGRRVYRLVVQHQPKVNPETLVVRVHLPPGARAVHAPGFERTGDVLLLERLQRKDLDLEVSWQE